MEADSVQKCRKISLDIPVIIPIWRLESKIHPIQVVSRCLAYLHFEVVHFLQV